MLILGDFSDWTEDAIKEHIVERYYTAKEEVDKYEFLVAYFAECGYEEWSFFLVREKATGQLFENHASHCSCYDFEGQWKPETTSVKYILSDMFSASDVSKEVQTWVKENLKEQDGTGTSTDQS
jgi:hypothetical protein